MTIITEKTAVERELEHELGKLEGHEHEKAFALVEKFTDWEKQVEAEFLARAAILARRLQSFCKRENMTVFNLGEAYPLLIADIPQKQIARTVWDGEAMTFN